MKCPILLGGLLAVAASACMTDVGTDEASVRDTARDAGAVTALDGGRGAGAGDEQDARVTVVDAAPQAPADAGRDAALPTESFKSIYEDIIAPRCATPYCHSATNRGGLNMTSVSLAYMRLVDQPAGALERDPYSLCKETGLVRVVPFDPESSLLIQKLAPAGGSVVCGKVMPENQKPLPADDIERLRRWIAQGALNN